MSRRTHLRSLADIVAVRTAQQDGARLAMGQADAALKAAADRVTLEDEAQAGRQAQWIAELTGPRLDLSLASAWAGAILQGQQALAGLGRQRDAAEADRAQTLVQWRLAHGRKEGAEDLLRTAARRARRAAEEATLAEAADRASRSGAQG